MTRPDRDRAGRVYGLTWPAPLRAWGRLELRILFWAARHFRCITADLRRLAVIRAASWAILDDVPNGNGGRRSLRRPVLFFDASFDVDLRRYIEVFAESIRWRFRLVWGSGTGYPGVLPAEGFLAWVNEERTAPSHYWCAYPQATTRMVSSGLRVAKTLEAFDREVADVNDEAFAAAFDGLLAKLANDL